MRLLLIQSFFSISVVIQASTKLNKQLCLVIVIANHFVNFHLQLLVLRLHDYIQTSQNIMW